MNRKFLGRVISDIVTVPLIVVQKVSQPFLHLANDVVQRFPRQLIGLGGDPDDPRGKVVYDFFAGIAPELANPGGSLPGANQWDAPPNTEHPVPVILVHGTAGGGQTNWGTYVPLLTGAGFSVFTLTYGSVENANWPISALGGMRKIEDSAEEFGAFVDKVLEATGASQVDIVGHSQGTLMPGYYAKFGGGAGKIRKYVSLAPLWQGTTTLTGARPVVTAFIDRFALSPATVVPCRALPQMMVDSMFITKMNADGGPYVEGIEYTNISTVHDELVKPYTSGQLEGGPGMNVTNLILQDGCTRDLSDHLGICGSPRAAAMVLNALDDSRQYELPCEVVAPFFGSPILHRTGGLPDLIKPFATSAAAE